MADDSTLSEHAAALRSEEYDRAQAILGLPELIAGVLVEPLTYERLEWLKVIGNPFICGGAIDERAILEFIWFVSPEWQFEGGDEKPAWKQFLVRQSSLNTIEAEEGIDAYIDRAFLDAPNSLAGVSFYAQTAGAYQALNSSYPGGGWTMEVVKKTPIRIALQLIKAADRDRGCVVSNRRSGPVISKWLSEIEHFELAIQNDFESEMDAFVDGKCAEGYVLASEPVQKIKAGMSPDEQASAPWIVPMRKSRHA